MLIRDMPPDEQPARRLTRHGAEYLSDAELLSLIVGGSSLDHARKLLSNGLTALSKSQKLSVKLQALFEISRRLQSETMDESEPITKAEELARRLIAKYSHYIQERLGGIFLDSKNRVITEREIYIGTLNATRVSTRDVIRIALEVNAASVIVFHNHPSGDPAPSAEDLTFTRKMQEASNLMGIDLTDHLILGQNRYVSLKQRGYF